MISRRIGWAFLGAACFARSAPAEAFDLYANTRYRSSVLEIPDGKGGVHDVSSIRTAGDASISREGFWSWDRSTLGYHASLLGTFDKVPYGDQDAALSSRLAEASLDFDFGSSIFLEGGKKKEKLGSGYFRHPVDIMVVDPVASRSSVGEDADRTREGLIGFGAMHVTPEYSFRLFLSPAMRWSDSGWIGRAVSSQQRLNQLFAKGTTRIGEVDLDVIYRHVIDTRDDGQASSLGGNVAGSYGDFFSWHAEGLLSQDVSRPLPPGQDGGAREEVQKLSYQGLVGTMFTPDAHWGLLVEYYHNGMGLSGSRYRRMVDHLNNLVATGRRGEVADIRSAYGNMNLGKHYLMFREAYSEQDLLTVEILGIINLQDQGAYAALATTYSPTGCIKLRGEYGALTGSKRTEIASMGELWHVQFGMELFY